MIDIVGVVVVVQNVYRKMLIIYLKTKKLKRKRLMLSKKGIFILDVTSECRSYSCT